MKTQTISITEAAKRLTEAGAPITGSSIRRWATSGFGIKVRGRWRVPERNVVEVERQLAAANDDRVPPCASAI